MSPYSYAIAANVRRYRNLLETSVDHNERQTIQLLLEEELAKATIEESEPKINDKPA